MHLLLRLVEFIVPRHLPILMHFIVGYQKCHPWDAIGSSATHARSARVDFYEDRFLGEVWSGAIKWRKCHNRNDTETFYERLSRLLKLCPPMQHHHRSEQWTGLVQASACDRRGSHSPGWKEFLSTTDRSFFLPNSQPASSSSPSDPECRLSCFYREPII